MYCITPHLLVLWMRFCSHVISITFYSIRLCYTYNIQSFCAKLIYISVKCNKQIVSFCYFGLYKSKCHIHNTGTILCQLNIHCFMCIVLFFLNDHKFWLPLFVFWFRMVKACFIFALNGRSTTMTTSASVSQWNRSIGNTHHLWQKD